jgi:hypothetical protein
VELYVSVIPLETIHLDGCEDSVMESLKVRRFVWDLKIKPIQTVYIK